MIARVFPRRTAMTPDDAYAFVGDPPLFLPEDIDEVHVSVAFTWDIPEAERLVESWSRVAPVKMGGPAFGDGGGEFTPGMYVKKGVTFTSRGCPNRCWFCVVPKRCNGGIKELEIKPGHILQDDNILACSDDHIRRVFDMLATQHQVKLTGGIEAKRLKQWHVEQFERVKVQEAFFAYDTPDDWEPLVEASKLLYQSSWAKPWKLRCYVLIGYHGDSIEKAEKRLTDACKLGFYPFAMYYRPPENPVRAKNDFDRLQWEWSRPDIVHNKSKQMFVGQTEWKNYSVTGRVLRS